MVALEKTYPPYSGTEPYLHFCFSEGSGKKARALLQKLFLRGVRVWYGADRASDRRTREQNDRRMLGADVTVVYLDDFFRNDPAAKSRLLACQRAGQRIICLNTDGGDSRLSLGLHGSAVEVPLSKNASAADAESALLHADGFSQELIGEPAAAKGFRLKAVVGILAALTVLLLAAGALWLYLHQSGKIPSDPTQTDTVSFADEEIRKAVRRALDGGAFTEERLSGVTELRLECDTLPADLSDLSLLPNLSCIELRQSAAIGAPEQVSALSDVYEIVLIGGGS